MNPEFHGPSFSFDSSPVKSNTPLDMLIGNTSYTSGQHGNESYRIVASGSPEHLATCSLVLNSVGIQHELHHQNGTLSVHVNHADAATRQIQIYFAENSDWPPPKSSVPIPSRGSHTPTLLMIGSLIIFFRVTGSWECGSHWFEIGAIDSQAILEHGQWWRLVTALSLHADQVHLIGNCIIGGFMVHLLCTTTGSGLGWLSLIILGSLGNLLNIAVRATPHHSVGFSTAIFAAIGIFSGLQIQGRSLRIKHLLMPLGAGAGLLAFLGTEGEHTDLGAHFFGFLCGLGGGMLIRYLELTRRTDKDRHQRTLFLLALLIFSGCWILAWTV